MDALTIEVMRKHIDAGEPKKCRSCPIALAILDSIPGSYVVSVDSQDATWHIGEDEHVCADLPLEAMRFIEAFDAGSPVSPFSFVLEPVEI